MLLALASSLVLATAPATAPATARAFAPPDGPRSWATGLGDDRTERDWAQAWLTTWADSGGWGRAIDVGLHVDVTALDALPMGLRERVERALDPARRGRLAKSTLDEFFTSAMIGDPHVVGGWRDGAHTTLVVRDVDFTETWTVEVVRAAGAPLLGNLVHVASGWSLADEVAASWVRALEGPARESGAESAFALAVDGLRAAREWSAEDVREAASRLAEACGDGDDPRVRSLRVLADALDWAMPEVADAADLSPAARRALALHAVGLDPVPAARARCEAALALQPYDAELLLELSRILHAEGNRLLATAYARDAARAAAADARQLYYFAWVQGGAGADELRAIVADGCEHVSNVEAVAAGWILLGDLDAARDWIAEQRARSPDDPDIAYYGAQLAIETGQPAAAAMQLAQAFEAAEERDELGAYHRQFVRAMHRAGKGREGYRMVERTSWAFEALAQELEADGNDRELLALCDEHAAEAGDSVLLDTWRARAFAAAGRHEEAIATARAARTRAEREGEWYFVGQAGEVLLDSLLALGGWRGAYDELGDVDRAFDAIANALARARDREGLAELFEHHAQRERIPPATRAFWECELAFLGDDPEAALEQFDARRGEYVDDDDPSSEAAWLERVATLCVRSGRLDRAGTIAAELAVNHFEPYAAALVALAGPQPADARPWLVDASARGDGSRALLEDPDVARLLERPEAAAVKAWLAERAERE